VAPDCGFEEIYQLAILTHFTSIKSNGHCRCLGVHNPRNSLDEFCIAAVKNTPLFVISGNLVTHNKNREKEPRIITVAKEIHSTGPYTSIIKPS